MHTPDPWLDDQRAGRADGAGGGGPLRQAPARAHQASETDAWALGQVNIGLTAPCNRSGLQQEPRGRAVLDALIVSTGRGECDISAVYVTGLEGGGEWIFLPFRNDRLESVTMTPDGCVLSIGKLGTITLHDPR